LDGTAKGKKGITYTQRTGFCLETQKYPDSPNKFTLPGWENSNAFVTPEKPYHSYCKYKFSIVE
jgi:aldose 1-epimerase